MELAKLAIAEGKHAEAVVLLNECLQYPHHLGEGKLYGAQENDFFYLLGLCYKAMRQEEKKFINSVTLTLPMLGAGDTRTDRTGCGYVLQ